MFKGFLSKYSDTSSQQQDSWDVLRWYLLNHWYDLNSWVLQRTSAGSPWAVSWPCCTSCPGSHIGPESQLIAHSRSCTVPGPPSNSSLASAFACCCPGSFAPEQTPWLPTAICPPQILSAAEMVAHYCLHWIHMEAGLGLEMCCSPAVLNIMIILNNINLKLYPKCLIVKIAQFVCM